MMLLFIKANTGRVLLRLSNPLLQTHSHAKPWCLLDFTVHLHCVVSNPVGGLSIGGSNLFLEVYTLPSSLASSLPLECHVFASNSNLESIRHPPSRGGKPDRGSFPCSAD